MLRFAMPATCPTLAVRPTLHAAAHLDFTRRAQQLLSVLQAAEHIQRGVAHGVETRAQFVDLTKVSRLGVSRF